MDAAIAAALVAMVTEVGLVSLSSGGFVTVQPATGSAYTVDGWMDRPGIGRAPGRAHTRDVGRLDGVRRRGGDHDRCGVGGDARLPRRLRRGARARRAPPLGRARRTGRRRRAGRLRPGLGVALLPAPRARVDLRVGPGEPRGAARRGGSAHRGPGRGGRPRRDAGADRRRRSACPPRGRPRRRDRGRRRRPRRPARARRPGGVRSRRPRAPDHPRRRLEPGDDDAPVGGRRGPRSHAAAPRGPTAGDVGRRRRRAPGPGAARGARPPARGAGARRRPRRTRRARCSTGSTPTTGRSSSRARRRTCRSPTATAPRARSRCRRATAPG